jgi:hypothetical protein
MWQINKWRHTSNCVSICFTQQIQYLLYQEQKQSSTLGKQISCGAPEFWIIEYV